MTSVDFTDVHLWHRLAWAHENLEAYQSDYRVVFEYDLDKPAAILVPDPNWMAIALHGGILPPVERYHEEERDEQQNFIGPSDYWSSYEAIPAMTEEEAIEYLVKKDVPQHVWKDKTANRPRFRICKTENLPASREWRDAWMINTDD
jgi:hypothetical protein